MKDPMASQGMMDVERRIQEFLQRVPTKRGDHDYPAMVRALGHAGVLNDAIQPDLVTPVLFSQTARTRERLGYHDPLLDLAFAMQGLGSYALRFGDVSVFSAVARQIHSGEAIAGFALTEPSAGSDLSMIQTRAVKDGATKVGSSYRIVGHKTLISNVGHAQYYTLFARTSDDPKRGISAFLLDAKQSGVKEVKQRVMGNHPIGELFFDGAIVPEAWRIGQEGDGLKIALAVLSRFRPTVGAFAVGLAQRAIDETVKRLKARVQFGAPLSEKESIQMMVGDMHTRTQAARLMVTHATETIDSNSPNAILNQRSSEAKLFATETAFSVIDQALQLHGGLGLIDGSVIRNLYENVRALRIYEGTSEIQRMIIGRMLMHTV